MEHPTDLTTHSPDVATGDRVSAFSASHAAKTSVCADRPEMPPAEQFYKLTLEQYHAMIRADILGEDDPVELLGGWLIRKMSKYTPHTTSTRLSIRTLRGVIPLGWFIGSQDPVTMTDSEPEPDVIIVRGREEDYAKHHPGPGDVALVIEVADSSLAGDRSWKLRIYARSGIRHYWIIDLNDRVIEVHSDPDPEAATYLVRQIHKPGESLALMIDGQACAEIAVDDLLP